MQTTTATATTTAAEAQARGFLLPCPKCGEAGATIDLTLSDLETFHCQDCDTAFEAADVRAFIARWSAVLAWVDAAPRLPTE